MATKNVQSKNKTTITAEPGKQELFITREFDAPRELVFKAYTDEKIYAQWLGPHGLETWFEVFEPVSGGKYKFVQKDKDGNQFSFHGVTHEVLPNERIIGTFEFDGLPEAGHVVLETTRFEALPGNRSRVVSQSVFQSVSDRDGMIQSGMEHGVREGYERLDDILAKGLCVAEFTMGRWTSARDRLLDAEEVLRARCTGVAWELDTTHTFELWARVYAGDFGAMAARTAQLLNEATGRGDLYAMTTFGSFMVPHARLVDDDTEGAVRAVDEYLRLWGIEGYHLQHMTGLMSRVYIDLYRGDGRSALQRLRAKRGWVRAGFFTTIQVLRVVMASLEGRAALMAAQGAPDRGKLLGLVRARARSIEREGVAWARPMARLLRAGLALADGRRDLAVSLLESAAGEFDAVPMHGYAAAARWRAADLTDGTPRGDALRQRAGEWMTRESIRSPDRMARMHAFGGTR